MSQASLSGSGPKKPSTRRTRPSESSSVTSKPVELAARFLNAVLAEAALASLHRRPRLSNAAIERSIRQVIEGLGRRTA